MSAAKSQTLNKPNWEGKIINVAARRGSKGATGMPGQSAVHFNQALDDDSHHQLRRLNTDKEQRGQRERLADTFARGTHGGLQADLAHMQAREGELGGNLRQPSAGQLSRGQLHQTSGASLAGISERDGLRNPVVDLTDSVADKSRPGGGPKRLRGLTDFLRKEYYRRMGVYCNGARDEAAMLGNFWKLHVSEAHRRTRELQKLAAQDAAYSRQQIMLIELEKKDPAAARRKRLDIEKKAEAKQEAIDRAERLKEKSATFGKLTQSTMKRPQSGAAHRPKGEPDWKPPGLHSKEMQSTVKVGGGAVGAAVPELPKTEKNAYYSYDFYKEQDELDVMDSINKDLADLIVQERTADEADYQKREVAMKAQKTAAEDQVIRRMLELFFFSDILDARAKEEQEKAAEEKKNAPAQAKMPSPPKDKVGKPPAGKELSMADLMKGGKPEQAALDLTQFDRALVDRYRFMIKLSEIVRTAEIEEKREKEERGKAPGKGVMTNDAAKIREIYQDYYASVPGAGGDAGSRLTDDIKDTEYITTFFGDANFLKRLRLHKAKICTSTTKKATSDSLYFIQMNKTEKQLNFLDHPTGQDVLVKEAKDKKTKEEEKQQKKTAAAEAKLNKFKSLTTAEEKERKRQERLTELAQPKDKWKVGKQLRQLQEKFPHDRVLQRMVKEEFKENQTFRYPEEYDVYHQSEENPKKVRPLADGKKAGLRPADYGAGDKALELFKQQDATIEHREKEGAVVSRRQALAFETAFIAEARAYLEQAKERLSQAQGERLTTRNALATIYQKFLNDPDDELDPLAAPLIKIITAQKYPVYTHGMVDDPKSLKKVFPDNFKRDFFRLVKTLHAKKPGRMTVAEVKKGSRRLPTTFMVVGGNSNHNKKILMTKTLATRRAKEMTAARSKVFYRQDYKESIANVFMSYDDQVNCRFEPISGSLNPYHKQTAQELKEAAEGKHESYQDRLGENFVNSNPEVYKLGVLKKAQQFYNKGEFETAMSTLTKGFNINSLKNHFDPDWYKKKLKEGLAKRFMKKKETKVSGVGSLDAMKEDITQDQKKMGQEDWEKKKLIPILTDAYTLVLAIEGKKTEAEKKVKALKAAKAKLQAKAEQLKQFNDVQDQMDNISEIFKTIMCPYREKCPKDRRTRWPKSGLTNVTQFGAACLYAHHPMELQFPETLKIQMQSITQTMKKVKAEAENKKPAKPFVPIGPLVDCNGCQKKCNMCVYRANNMLPTPDTQKTMNDKMRKQREKYDAPHVKKYIEEMRQIGEDLKLNDEVGKKKVIDDNYYLKFGHLKKAAVLKFYGRNNDAYKEVIKAGEIVKAQRAINVEKDAAIQKRWQFKLGLDPGYTCPIDLARYHPADPRLEKELKTAELDGVPLQTVKMYIEKCSPFNLDAFSKNVYLDRCIEDLIIECEAGRMDQKNSIDMLKKQVEKLEEIAELADAFGEEGLEDQLDEEGEPIKFKPRKTKMCECVIEPSAHPEGPKCIFHNKPKGVWKYDREAETYAWRADTDKDKKNLALQEEMSMELGSMTKTTFERKKHFNCPKQSAHTANPKKHAACPKAHNPLELELIPVTDKIANLKGVIQVSKDQINNNKTLNAWIPANSKKEADISCFQPYVEKMFAKVADDEAGDDKPKSIFERENLFRNMEDDKD